MPDISRYLLICVHGTCYMHILAERCFLLIGFGVISLTCSECISPSPTVYLYITPPCTSLRRRRLSCGSVDLLLPLGLFGLGIRFLEEALGSTSEREQLHGLQSCLVCDLVRPFSLILYRPPAHVSRASHVHLSAHVFKKPKADNIAFTILRGGAMRPKKCDSTASISACISFSMNELSYEESISRSRTLIE
ncbi:hypothetical protein EDB19DRAFT_163265 [Suillus lakei]|nr:hypothetical protein EDB19DRAFT_163265 [Suillus lakei]